MLLVCPHPYHNEIIVRVLTTRPSPSDPYGNEIIVRVLHLLVCYLARGREIADTRVSRLATSRVSTLAAANLCRLEPLLWQHCSMSKQFGKNERADYRSVTGRVPDTLKRQLKARAGLDDLDINTVVEGLLSLYVSGVVTAEAIRAAVEGSPPPPGAAPPRPPATSPAPGRRRGRGGAGSSGGEPAPDRVRSIRNRLGLTQAELGELLGKTRPTVSGYEQGEPLPPEVAARLDDLDPGPADTSTSTPGDNDPPGE